MNIAIISREKIENRKFWSGTIENSYNILRNSKDIDIIKIDSLDNNLRKIFAIKREFLSFFKGEKFDETYNINVSKNYANQINSQISKQNNLDFILSFDASLIAYIKTKVPIIFWTDLLYSDYYKHYFKKEKIYKQTKNSIKVIEKRAVSKSKYIFLSSNWAINRAKKNYLREKNKFRLMRFGPNFKKRYTKSLIKTKINSKQNKVLRLITLSVDWKRKGVRSLIKLKEIIKNKKINVEILIVGSKNKQLLNYDKDIKIINFIDKNQAYGENKISNLLFKSHFHILFSNAEAYGISLIEANMHGLPNITFSTGAINELIINNRNGKKFNHKVNLDIIANYLIKLFKNKKKYKELCNSSYNEFINKYSNGKIISDFKNNLLS